MQDWLKVNRLALNVKKTKYMMFHKHNKIVKHLDLHILIGRSNYDSLIVRTVAFPVQVAYWIKRS